MNISVHCPHPKSFWRHLVLGTSALAILSPCPHLLPLSSPFSVAQSHWIPWHSSNISSMSRPQSFCIYCSSCLESSFFVNLNSRGHAPCCLLAKLLIWLMSFCDIFSFSVLLLSYPIHQDLLLPE